MVGRETWVERDAEEPALACGRNRQRDERRREERAVLDDAELPGLLGDEQPAVRRELHGRRAGQTIGDQGFGET